METSAKDTTTMRNEKFRSKRPRTVCTMDRVVVAHKGHGMDGFPTTLQIDGKEFPEVFAGRMEKDISVWVGLCDHEQDTVKALAEVTVLCDDGSEVEIHCQSLHMGWDGVIDVLFANERANVLIAKATQLNIVALQVDFKEGTTPTVFLETIIH